MELTQRSFSKNTVAFITLLILILSGKMFERLTMLVFFTGNAIFSANYNNWNPDLTGIRSHTHTHKQRTKMLKFSVAVTLFMLAQSQNRT
jgi:hypothetical protein